jgi:signal transduction histidine kinase
MTLAYIDAGQTRVSKSRVAAVELVSGCATVIRPLAEARGLTFTLTADPAVEVDTDRDKLREVLMNLLHNAVEYNNPGGSVELAVHPNGGGRIAFDVRDTGIGMTGEVKGRIFERFYRADPSRTETGVHAGLGLAIVKEYVERLGGTITVESAPGKGSLFRVEIPAAKDEAEPPKLAT